MLARDGPRTTTVVGAFSRAIVRLPRPAAPTDFDLLAGIAVGVPILTLPVKIRLVGQSIDLGPSCFIGSDATPIILKPANTDVSNAVLDFVTFDPDGSLDAVVNAVVGLPSPAGANDLVLEDAGSAFVLPPEGTSGAEFSAFWHTAFD